MWEARNILDLIVGFQLQCKPESSYTGCRKLETFANTRFEFCYGSHLILCSNLLLWKMRQEKGKMRQKKRKMGQEKGKMGQEKEKILGISPNDKLFPILVSDTVSAAFPTSFPILQPE